MGNPKVPILPIHKLLIQYKIRPADFSALVTMEQTSLLELADMAIMEAKIIYWIGTGLCIQDK